MTRQPVALLHGLWRRPRSMETPARWLAKQGFEAHNLSYPSRQKPLRELAAGVATELERRFSNDGRRVHFLTHSMGGIVLRTVLALEQEGHIERSWLLGRVVMLAPPNQGSVLANQIGDWRLFRWLFNQAGQELRANSECTVGDLPSPRYLGVVAGTRSIGTFRRALRGTPQATWQNDGTVAVQETHLGDAPVVTVAAMHAFIMNNREALEHAAQFFRTGRFE